MFSYIVKRDRFFVALFGAAVLGLVFCLPNALGPRAWCVFAASLLLPVGIVGRTRQRAVDGWLNGSRFAHRGRRVFRAERTLDTILLVVFSVVCGGGEWIATLGVFTWCLALVSFADLLDRAVVQPPRVWIRLFLVGLGFLSAPFWLAPWYGQTEWAPQLATLGIGLHPIAALLGSFGQPTLQDPVLYRITLSGVVEVRPLWWGYGVFFYGLIGLVCVCFSAMLERRIGPVDSVTAV